MPPRVVEKISAPAESRYGRCCWGLGCCHIRTCVYIIGIVELVTLAVAVITVFALYELSADTFINVNPNSMEKNGKVENSEEVKSLRRHFNETLKRSGHFERHRANDSSESSEEDKDKHRKMPSSDSSEEDESGEDQEKDVVYLRAKHRYYVRTMAGTAAAFVVAIFVVALMFTGLARRRPGFLLPHLGAQVLSILGLIAVIVLYSIWCTSGSKAIRPEALYTIKSSLSCWLILTASSIALVFEAISFWSVLTCYRYMNLLIQSEHHSKEQFWATYNGPREDMGKCSNQNWATVPGMHIVGNKV